MLKNSFPLHAARRSKRGGFTLVELLVVIGIIAILAGVALGPITRGLKTAKQNAAMQNARSVSLCEFQYSIDNDGSYPDGTDSALLVQKLFLGKYLTDPGILYMSGGKEVKYTGNTPSTGIAVSNISWDFAGVDGGTGTAVGVSSSAPDQLPVVWGTGNNFNMPANAGAGASLVTGGGIFGFDGVPVAYKSNSAFFKTVKNADGKTVDNFVDPTFDPGTVTYVIRKGGG